MNALENLIERFQSEQGWTDETVYELLKRFLWERQDKWMYKSMLADLESNLNEVASIENDHDTN